MNQATYEECRVCVMFRVGYVKAIRSRNDTGRAGKQISVD
jgi:hypothetical protein